MPHLARALAPHCPEAVLDLIAYAGLLPDAGCAKRRVQYVHPL